MVAAARGASRAALVVVLLTLVAVTAACGAADPAGSPPPESSSPSSPSSASSPCGTATGQTDDVTSALLGLSEAEATERAGASGLQVRVVGRGSECYAVTADHRPDRVNLDLDDDGRVRAAGRG